MLQRISTTIALCALAAVAVADPPAPPSPEHPFFVQQLLNAFPPDESLPAPEVEVFLADVQVAKGVTGHTCLVSVPSQLIFGDQPNAGAEKTNWVLTTPPDATWTKPPKPNTLYVQFWCVPLKDYQAVGEHLSGQLRPAKPNGCPQAEIVHLGNGENYAVFACLPRMQWPALQQRLHLAGGADAIDVAVNHLDVTKPTTDLAQRSYAALASGGDQAIEAASYLVSVGSAHRANVIQAMSAAETPAVTKWLSDLTASDDKNVVRAAQKALLARPRPEAADLYVAWLTEWAGQASVEAEMLACATVDAKAALGPLGKVMAQPYNIREYLLALKIRRQLEGRPVSDDLRNNAGKLVNTLAQKRSMTRQARVETNEVIDQITTSGDIEATAAIGVELAMADSPTLPRRATLNKAGVYILAQLPPKQRLQMVNHLAAKSCQPAERRQLRTLEARVKAEAAKPKGPPTAKKRD